MRFALNLNRDAQALLSVLRKFQKNANELTWVTGDYCDVWLTHDSASGMTRACFLVVYFLTPGCAVRKAHNSGRNHLMNVRDYYACRSPFHTISGLATHAIYSAWPR